MELNCAERDLREKIDNNYDDGRVLTIGRTAHLTGDMEVDQVSQGLAYKKAGEH